MIAWWWLIVGGAGALIVGPLAMLACAVFDGEGNAMIVFTWVAQGLGFLLIASAALWIALLIVDSWLARRGRR